MIVLYFAHSGPLMASSTAKSSLHSSSHNKTHHLPSPFQERQKGFQILSQQRSTELAALSLPVNWTHHVRLCVRLTLP